MPAGHIRRAEPPAAAAARELTEETGIDDVALTFIGRIPISGDKCRLGAGAHVWHLYRLTVPAPVPITLNDEGISPIWLTAADARSRELTHAMAQILEICADTLDRG